MTPEEEIRQVFEGNWTKKKVQSCSDDALLLLLKYDSVTYAGAANIRRAVHTINELKKRGYNFNDGVAQK